MKNRVILSFIFVLLIIGVLSVEGVWSAGATEKPSSDKNKCILRSGYEYLFNPVGCDCMTGGSDVFISDPLRLKWSRSNWDKGPSIGSSDNDREDDGSNYYCYVDDPLSKIKPGTGSGKGHVRMCTDDKNSTYTADYAGGNERNRECSYAIPFCNKDEYTCNECRDDTDCSKTGFAQLNLDKLIQTKCLEQSDIEIKTIKSCEYCINVNGTGDTKIIFVIGQLPPGKSQEEIAQEIYNGIIGTEPFKYLHNQKNAFTFAYTSIGNTGDFNKRYYANVLTTSSRPHLTDKFKKTVIKKAEQVCGGDATVIYIDYFDGKPTDYYSPSDKLIVLSTGSMGMLIHGLGHAIGDLSDESALPYKRKSNDFQSGAVNIQEPDYPADGDSCPKFTNFGVNTPNCFDVADGGVKNKGYKKSTPDSVMSHSGVESRFNVISCAGILNKVLGAGIEQGVNYCQDTMTPEGYAIYSGIIPQGIDYGIPFNFIQVSPEPCDKTTELTSNLYNNEINTISKLLNVNPNLIRAMIQKESSWDAAQITGNAIGLMQVIGTGGDGALKEINDNPTFCPSYASYKANNNNDLKNPGKNIYYGTCYLKLLNERYNFNGYTDLILAAYNGGPTIVINNCKNPDGSWMTFKSCKGKLHSETQDYVPKVSDYYYQYLKIFPIGNC